jgi:hypothetical protein
MGPNDRAVYQHNFSKLLGGAMYDEAARHNKARKILAIVSDYARGRRGEYTVLDLGCSTAIIDDPIRFAATDVCTPGSRLQRLAALFARKAHWLIPTYVFVLKKDAVCQ